MDKKEAQAQIDYMRRLMERSVRYTNLSPASAIGIGVLGSAAAGYSQWLLNGTMLYTQFLTELTVCWTACFLSAILASIFFSVRRAKTMNEKIWIEPVRQGLIHFSMAALLGGVLTAALSSYYLFFLIPPVWMLCYGTGLYAAGFYSLKELKALGTLFFLSGTVAVFFPLINFILLMLTFGLGHVVLGIVIYRQYSEPNATRTEP